MNECNTSIDYQEKNREKYKQKQASIDSKMKGSLQQKHYRGKENQNLPSEHQEEEESCLLQYQSS